VNFSSAGIRRGFVRGQGLAVGVFGYAIAFGLLASDAGLSVLEALLMSATVYSGSAQVATVGGLATGAGILASVVTVLMLNARYLLYGASLRPWLGTASPGQAYSSLYFLGDGNWLLSMKAHADGEQDTGFVFGSGIVMFAPWIAGTLLGSLAGNWIAQPKTLALDFLLVAFCMAMAVDMLKSRAGIRPAAAALAVALVLDWLAPSGWTIVITGLVGAVVGYALYREEA